MKLTLASPTPDRSPKQRFDAWSVFWFGDDTRLPREERELVLAAVPKRELAEGAFFTTPLPKGERADRLYVWGCGKDPEISPRKARKLIRQAVQTLTKNGETSALFDFPFGLLRMNAGESREFLLRTLALSGYAFRVYKSRPSETPGLSRVAARLGAGPFASEEPAAIQAELLAARATLAAVEIVRDLGNTPASDMPPRKVAELAVRHGRARGLDVRVLDRKGIEKERLAGLLAVGRGSAEEPRLVVASYRGGVAGRPIALIGKGITFDSGGLSLKPAERMGEMKWDMLGAATVLGVALAAAELKLPVNLVAILALAENLPSGTAFKPGDIVRFRNGKTAEIDNTDAEGRVILADVLHFAAEMSPSVMLDFATLTGAAAVALGHEAAALFTPDDRLAAELIDAGERTDERLWRMPLWDDYKENIRSDWADFKNSGGKPAGAINAALFLKEFVDPALPWAHLDIAPTGHHERERGGHPVGASGFGVALTLRWLRDRLLRPEERPPAAPTPKRRRGRVK